jgi:hypothetical protein
MEQHREGNNAMKIMNRRAAEAVSLVILFFQAAPLLHAQPGLPPPPANRYLDSWSFGDTTWESDQGYAPLIFTNLVLTTNFGGALLLDTTNELPAYLVYNVVESDGTTNLTLPSGTISFWFAPDWSSTNAGGTGPGSWGRIFEAGSYTTNASIGWLSLYFSPDGSAINFAGQTNNGSGAVYLSAPVNLTNNTWNNLVLTYGPTNSWLYWNGLPVTNGSGVAWYPGPGVLTNGFSIGSSAADGFSQARGIFSSAATYSYQWSSNAVYLTYGMYLSRSYGGGVGSPLVLTNAPSVPAIIPTFDAITGPGALTFVSTNTSGCITSSNVWITNVTAILTNNQTVNFTFTIAGGSNNVPYDVFATTTLASPMTNATWVWMGQGYHCSAYSVPIQSNSAAFFILGTPQDTDQDGLTDAYEILVSKTNPNNPSTAGNGILDGWAVLWGLNPNVDATAQTGLRANFTYDPAPQLEQVSGIRGETIGPDPEGNILTAH